MVGKLNQKRLNEENNFLAVAQDWKKITQKILENDKLLKLIYYNSPDALEKENLTNEEKQGLINKNILSYPFIPDNTDVENYIQILFDNFLPNEENPEYIDNTISITIFCNRQNWVLTNWRMRLYSMANEVMNLLNKKKLTGIGITNFIGGVSIVPSENIIGITLNFLVINSVNTKDDND